MFPIADIAASKLPFKLLDSQRQVLNAMDTFIHGQNPREVFVLNGYAGTGKTSIVGAFIRTLEELKIPVVLLAPTGRAAKVASQLSSHRASTIHKRLYRGNSLDPGNTSFFLAPNESANTIFIVDEASLIPDYNDNRSLLSHLIHHVYSAPGCKLMLIGDEAQLPPVGETESRAMNPDRLKAAGLYPLCHTLSIPVRQTADSGIIRNATIVREMMRINDPSILPELEVDGYADIKVVSSTDLPDLISASWQSVGVDETLIITRANWRANEYNRAIRNLVMFADSPIQRGDRLVISKNDYYWSRKNKLSNFLANGETAEVTWVGKMQKAYGRWFCDVELTPTDGTPLTALLMMRSLVCDGPSLPRAEMERFYNRVLDNYDGEISHKIKGTLEDPYYNALQAKYAYCVTCHKAQGGQWKHIYIDMSGIDPESLDTDFYRWLYTAITRATERVYLINPTLPGLRPE